MNRSVLFILPSFAGGGAERVLVSLCNGLARTTYDSGLIALSGQGPLSSILDARVKVQTLDCMRLRSGLIPLRRAILRAKPNIVISTMAYMNWAILGLSKVLPPSIRYVVREANTIDATLSSIPSPKIGRFLYRSLYKRADIIIAPSYDIATCLQKVAKLPKGSIQILANPVDVERVREGAKIIKRKKHVGPSFLAAGRLSHQKGFDRLIKNFSKTPQNAHLTILGEGPEADNLKRIASTLNIASRVDFPGFVNNPWAYMAGADAFLISSRWEGMPNVALEALACGTPVIASCEAGGINDLAKNISMNNLMIVKNDDLFIKALSETSIDPVTRPRASLLPECFEMVNAVSAFKTMLEELR